MECCFHGGTDECEIPQRNKPIEVRSNGRKVRSSGMKVRSNGMEVRSNGRKVRSNGMKVRSNGMEVRSNGRKVRSNGTRIPSNGMQVAIRLHFCPECPSIPLYTRTCFWSVKFKTGSYFLKSMKKVCALGQILDKSTVRIFFGEIAALSLQLQFKCQCSQWGQCFTSSFYGHFYITSNLVCRFYRIWGIRWTTKYS